MQSELPARRVPDQRLGRPDGCRLLDCCGYRQASCEKLHFDEHRAFGSAYFLELGLPREQLERNIPSLFTDPACGHVLRVKGFVQDAGGWVELNATADGLTAADVSVTLELPERYLLGVDPAVYAVYTIHGRDVQETASVRVPAAVTGLEELLAKSANATLPASRDVGPKRIAGGLLAISVGATVLAALAAFGVVRLRIKWKKRKSRSKH